MKEGIELSSQPSGPNTTSTNDAFLKSVTPNLQQTIGDGKPNGVNKLGNLGSSRDVSAVYDSAISLSGELMNRELTCEQSMKPPKERIKPKIRQHEYIEYDLSTMKNSYGGFINIDDSNDQRTSNKGKTFEMWQREQRERRLLYEEMPPPIDISEVPKCTECKVNMELDPTMKDIFHLEVCKTCVKAYPEKYTLLTKTECKEDYFITDPELNDTELFERLEKPNPHSGTFARMQLFVRCKVEQFAFKKWGGEEGLDKEWQRREERKQEIREKKYQQQLKEMRMKTRAQEYTLRLKEKKYGKAHEHEFGAPVDGGTNDDGIPISKRRCFGCGLEMEEIYL